MEKWLDSVKSEFGIELEFDSTAVLQLTRDIAHNIERPAAPLTTFLLGYLVAQGQDLSFTIDRVNFLIKNWPKSE